MVTQKPKKIATQTSSSPASSSDFLSRLQKEAALQANLAQNHLLPRRLSPLANYIFNHAFFAILFISFLSALITNWLLTL